MPRFAQWTVAGQATIAGEHGRRVLLNVLNAGATETYRLELPGHVFEIRRHSMGNPCPPLVEGLTAIEPWRAGTRPGCVNRV